LLAKYFHSRGKNFTTAADLTTIRLNSVLWGCPEWTKTQDYNPAPGFTPDNVYNGYGMQSYPLAADWFIGGNLINLGTYNLDAAGNVLRRGYHKETVWTRKPSADRLLVADSQVDLLQMGKPASYPISAMTIMFQPYDPYANQATALYVDARHVKRGTPKRVAVTGKSLNALFCDGHVAAVSVKEAYNAIRNPGQDSLLP
jgi:prepilin-type processing-associated H-X9-DG protein